MKIVCLVSSGKGHLDFGGGGFLKLAKAFEEAGHEVVFQSDNHQRELIISAGFHFEEVKNIDRLWVNNYNLDKNTSFEYLCALKMIEGKVVKQKPDLILLDRILGLAEGFLNSNNIPFIGIGTPGGVWEKNNDGITPKLGINKYQALEEILEEKIGWVFSEISAWCNSSIMNISFIGKEFYDHGVSSKSEFIDMPFEIVETELKNRVGLSLGTGTFDIKATEKFINALDFSKKHKLEILGREIWWDKLSKQLSADALSNINYTGFINFDTELSQFSKLIFSGGISTIWYCVKHNIVPVIVPAGYNDQAYNANRIHELGSKPKFTYSATLDEIVRKIEYYF
jgi:hypothetical protein